MPTAAGGRRYAGRAADERRAERRRRLLDAAVALFGTRGYSATTIEALYTEAKLAPRHFYEQFAGREQLLRAVYDETIELVATAVNEARAAAPPGAEGRVRAILEAFARATLSDPRRARIAYLEVPGTTPELQQHATDAMRAFAAVVEDEARAGAKAGRLPDRDYALTAMLLVGGTTAILLNWLSDEERRPPIEDVIDELTAAFVTVLRTPR